MPPFNATLFAIQVALDTWGETKDVSTLEACKARLLEWQADPGCQSDPVTSTEVKRLLGLLEPKPGTVEGYQAIGYAEAYGLTLSKYTDPTEEARTGLSVEDAKAIAAADEALIYLTLPHNRIAHEIKMEDLESGDLYRELHIGGQDLVLCGTLEALLADVTAHASRAIYRQIGTGEDSYRDLVTYAAKGA